MLCSFSFSFSFHLKLFKITWIRTCDLFPFKITFRKYQYFRGIAERLACHEIATYTRKKITVRRGHMFMSRVEFAHKIQFLKQSKAVWTSEGPF